jgi:hypothetical protein
MSRHYQAWSAALAAALIQYRESCLLDYFLAELTVTMAEIERDLMERFVLPDVRRTYDELVIN